MPMAGGRARATNHALAELSKQVGGCTVPWGSSAWRPPPGHHPFPQPSTPCRAGGHWRAAVPERPTFCCAERVPRAGALHTARQRSTWTQGGGDVRSRAQDRRWRHAGDLSSEGRDGRAPVFPGADAVWTVRAGRPQCCGPLDARLVCRPADVLQDALAQDIGIALARARQLDDLVRYRLPDVVGIGSDLQGDADLLECDAEDAWRRVTGADRRS
jgi:hypothetical protein